MLQQIEQLTSGERELLTTCEATIEKGLATFIEVGEALATIREGKLYRATHGTWEDYCREKWGISRAHASRLMSGAETARRMLPNGYTLNERQARALSGFAEAVQPAILMTAAARYGKVKLTASKIERVGRVVEQMTLTGHVEPIEGQTAAVEAALDLEDVEAEKRQKQYVHDSVAARYVRTEGKVLSYGATEYHDGIVLEIGLPRGVDISDLSENVNVSWRKEA